MNGLTRPPNALEILPNRVAHVAGVLVPELQEESDLDQFGERVEQALRRAALIEISVEACQHCRGPEHDAIVISAQDEAVGPDASVEVGERGYLARLAELWAENPGLRHRFH
jgi:hypothetical protein